MSNAGRVSKKFIAGELPGLDISESSIYDIRNVSPPISYLVDGTPLLFNKETNKWEPKFYEVYENTTTNNRFGIFVTGYKNIVSTVEVSAIVAMISTWGSVGTHLSADLTIEGVGDISLSLFKEAGISETSLEGYVGIQVEGGQGTHHSTTSELFNTSDMSISGSKNISSSPFVENSFEITVSYTKEEL